MNAKGFSANSGTLMAGYATIKEINVSVNFKNKVACVWNWLQLKKKIACAEVKAQ